MPFDRPAGHHQGVQLPGQVAAVLSKDRAEQREPVVGGIRRQDEDQCGCGLHGEEHDAVVAENGSGDLGDHRPLRIGGAVPSESD